MWVRFRIVMLLLISSGAAQAHLLPKQNATMHVVDSAAFFVVSVPVSTLSGVDDDGNGLLSPNEIQRHDRDIKRQFAARFHISDGANIGKSALTWIVPPQTDGPPTDSDYVVVLQRTNFLRPPGSPTLATDLFGSKSGESQMTLTARRGKTAEVAILSVESPQHTFFQSRWSLMGDFIRVGVFHILTGIDHLLFLLTIVVAAVGWRYWFAVVTSFTIGHSITLALSAFNLIRLPPTIVEPAIAASIVAMALLNLRATRATGMQLGWPRVAIVFACGLLHGCGFASAIGSIGIDTLSRVSTLAGFNIGIEIGQFTSLVTVWALTYLIARFCNQATIVGMPRLASMAAGIIGSALLVQRVIAP